MQRIDLLSGVKLNWISAVHRSTFSKGILHVLDVLIWILLNISAVSLFR